MQAEIPTQTPDRRTESDRAADRVTGLDALELSGMG